MSASCHVVGLPAVDRSIPTRWTVEPGAQGVSGRSERLDEDCASVGYLVGGTGQVQRPT
jgi:hypothetical protein